MSPVTTDPSKNFQEFSPLPTHSLTLLPELFSTGDADPSSPMGPGAENAIRLNRAREVIASNWGLPHECVIFVADRYLAFHLAILGSIATKDFTEIVYSPIDKKEILAIVSGLDPSIQRNIASVNITGEVTSPHNSSALRIHQARNGETGIFQESMPDAPIVIDATSLTPIALSLPNTWRAVVMDACSWGGPRGVYPVAINPHHPWRNPLPTLDTSLPTFGSNYALTLLAATSLESFLQFDLRKMDEANLRIREIVARIADVDVAGSHTRDRLSLSFLYVQSEELQRRLFGEGFVVDSGSACSSSALEPSHVLAEMGLLAQGNVRLRFRPENLTQAEPLARALVYHVQAMRDEL